MVFINEYLIFLFFCSEPERRNSRQFGKQAVKTGLFVRYSFCKASGYNYCLHFKTLAGEFRVDQEVCKPTVFGVDDKSNL